MQLVRAAGGRVIAAARGRRKLGIVRTLGADVVVDYSEPGWPKRVRDATGGTGPDVVFDGAGGELGRAAFEITARGGRFSADGGPSGGFTMIDPYEAEHRRVTVRGIEQVQFSPAELHRMTERALAEAAAGRIKPVIGRTFPLEQAADAHAAIEAREVIGKTLLVTDGNDPTTAMFTEVERRYLRNRRLGRLATVGPDGAPQNLPVVYWMDDADETIDIGGPALSDSQKFRNIKADSRVSFVVDDYRATRGVGRPRRPARPRPRDPGLGRDARRRGTTHGRLHQRRDPGPPPSRRRLESRRPGPQHPRCAMTAPEATGAATS